MTKTLAHELAHHFGGGTKSNPEEETFAESVSYVVCARFGLDTGERSFPYVATWSKEPKTLKAAMTRIQATSSQMIERLEPSGPVPREQVVYPASAVFLRLRRLSLSCRHTRSVPSAVSP